jgi:C4-dicarboxylate-specific signal transduction histidine kinase
VELQQVLLNLVVNAMDAMRDVPEPERLLAIRARLERDAAGAPVVAIGVTDRGTGLEPDQARRIFEAFYTTKPNGMGLGLAISRSIVEAHGGRLSVETSTEPGATFAIRLPVAEASPLA